MWLMFSGWNCYCGSVFSMVFRFDVPGWVKYDDTRVTSTNSTSIR